MTNNTNMNIVIYVAMCLILCIVLWACCKRCKKKSQTESDEENVDRLSTEKCKIIITSVSEVSSQEPVSDDNERPSSAIDHDKTAFFDNMQLLDINVRTADGNERPLKIWNTAAVSDLKTMIAKHLDFGIHETKQEIRYKKERINSICRIVDLSIESGDTIELFELSDDKVKDVLKITIQCDEMGDRHVYCSNLTTVRQFKEEVKAKIQVVPKYDQVLYFEGYELTDLDATLQEYGMHGNKDCTVVFEWKKVEVTLQ